LTQRNYHKKAGGVTTEVTPPYRLRNITAYNKAAANFSFLISHLTTTLRPLLMYMPFTG
jgi:hypothetical protein